MKTDYEIFEKNRGLLLKKAQKYRLTANQAFQLTKYTPKLKTKLLTYKNADDLAWAWQTC